MDDIQAAVLLARLEFLDENINKREKLANYFNESLKDIPMIKTPHILKRDSYTSEVNYVYSIEAEDRDALVKYLEKNYIETEIYYPIPLHLQPCFRYLGYRKDDFPVAEKASTRSVALPFYPDLTYKQIDYICTTIKEFYKKGKKI